MQTLAVEFVVSTDKFYGMGIFLCDMEEEKTFPAGDKPSWCVHAPPPDREQAWAPR